MKALLISSLLLFFMLNINSQVYYKDMADEICKELQGTDLTQDKSTLQQNLITTTNKVYSKYPEIITKLQEDIKQENPSLSNNDLTMAVGNTITLYLLENCNIFLKINQIAAQIRPYPDKKCLKLINTDLCDLLEKNKGKSYPELDKIVNDNLFSFVKKYENQINIDYSDGIANPDFSDDLNAYLFKNCDIYFLISLLLHG